MRHLLLVRHAKSSWDEPGLADHERPLNRRGRRDAPVMGARLAARGFVPDCIVTSHAVRASTTARLIADAVGYAEADIRVDERIYEEGGQGVIAAIADVEPAVERLMVVGHNPTVTHLANRFGAGALANLPTCGMVFFEAAVDHWGEIDATRTRFLEVDYPKKTPG